MVHAVSCHDISPLLVRTDLDGAEAECVATHLADCDACREAIELMRPVIDVGTEVEGYRLARVIGRGGTSTVYEAHHATVARRVAIKILDRELVSNRELRTRFLRDAEIAASLRGEHICRTTSLGVLPSGEPYMVLEFLDGEDLATIVDRGALAPDVVADHGLQICEGLAEAHARGIVHRDLKPANLVRVTRPSGEPLVKILDFGIAKRWNVEDGALTETGVALGSVPYMSPEQLRSSRSVDARSDIWSLGATLHHLASGAPPFPARASLPEAAIRIWTDAPAALDGVPFAHVIARCLGKRAEDRYADVGELAEALAPFAPGGAAIAARVARILRR